MAGNVTVGHPVDVATGVMHNTFTDISIQGKVALEWPRYYSTALTTETKALGPSWHNKYFCSLTFKDGEYLFIGPEGSHVTLADPHHIVRDGKKIISFGDFTELWFENGFFHVCQWDVETGENWRYLFAYQPDSQNHKISQLKQILDPTGQGLELAYDDKKRLVGVRQKLEKRCLVLRYGDSQQIESIEFLSADKKTRETLAKYQYDPLGRLITAIDALGYKDHFEYDKNNRIIREIYKDGAISSFKYDAQGRCINTSGLDRYDWKKLKFIDNANCTEVTDSQGHVRSFQYNDQGQVLREVNPLGAVYLTEYDDFGRIVSKTDPLGAVTRFEYDAKGNRSQIIDALGQQTAFEYNKHHQVESYTNPAGHVWRRHYDALNQLISVEDPLGNSYKLRYDGKGNLVEIADPLNNKLRQAFNGLGVLHAATDWQGNVTAYQADEYGRLVQKTDPLGAITRYEYDLLNHLTAVHYPDNTHNRYAYDAAGNLNQVVDRNEQTTRFRFGPCSRLLERVDPLGNTLRFTWGTEPQRLETVINAKGETYQFNYNAVGWVIGETGFDGRELGFEYDLAGNRIASINGLGERISFQRDALGRLVQQMLPDSTTADFAYDAAGFLQKACNSVSAIEFERDVLGRIVLEIQNGIDIAREYDAVGNLKSLETSLGHRIDYCFDANGLLAAFTKDNADTIQVDRDARGSEVERILPGGVRLQQQFDSIGRLLEQEVFNGSNHNTRTELDAANTLVKRSYRYNKVQLVGIQDSTWGKTTYVYDPAEHLLQVLRDKGASERFSYDANDNLTQIERDGKQETLLYGDGDRLLSKDDTTYEYDDQGRLIAKKEIGADGIVRESRYFWDALDQLQAFENSEGKRWEYAYDPFGRRIQKCSPDGHRHGFVWDEDVVLHETQNGKLSVSWVFDPHSFAPLCKFENDGVYSIITDHLGTPKEMVDRSGKLVWQTDYYAWGKVSEQIKGEVDCPVRFQGQWWDEESGLNYNFYRYYHSTCGRYISGDPIVIKGGYNLFNYTINPVSWIDPFGWQGETVVTASFEHQGNTFEGVNPTAREQRTPGATIPGLRGPNTSRADMHAEIDAMLQAHDAGQRGGHGRLTISGMDACSRCRGDIKTMARALNLDSLTVDNNGRIITFNREELRTMREGGKGWCST